MSEEKRQPWMKWYWSDWRASPKLRLCCLAARGLWAEILALCEAGEPYGHLTVSGIAPTPKQLAIQVGAAPKEIEELLQELEEAKVFSRTDAGVIYSRRMVRDKAKADQDKANGSKGGNPQIRKSSEMGKPGRARNGETGKPTTAEIATAGKPPPPEIPRRGSEGGKPKNAEGVKAQRPEARGQIPKPDSQASPPDGAGRPSHEDVGELIAIFDRAQVQVFAGFARQQPTGKDLTTATRWLQAGLTLEAAPALFETIFRSLLERGKPVPKSLVFIDNEVMAYVSERKAAKGDPREYFGTDRAGQLLEESYWRVKRFYERNKWDDDQWGPRPGEPGCRVPPRVFEVYREINGGEGG